MPDIVWGDEGAGQAPPPLDIDRIVKVLNDHEVDYVVIGGIAVIAHGNPRATFDLDLIASLEADNLARLAAALVALDARAFGIDGQDVGVDPTDPTDLARGGNWVLVTDAGRLDIMSAADGAAPYHRLIERAVHLPARAFDVVGLDDLIAMKQAANRDKDRADIAALTALHAIAPPSTDANPDVGADMEKDVCGVWMPVRRATCGRPPEHQGRHGLH